MADTTRGAPRRRYVFLAAAIALAAGLASTQVCLRVGFTAGVWLRECPDGELHQAVTVQASRLTRGAPSAVTVSATALYTIRAHWHRASGRNAAQLCLRVRVGGQRRRDAAQADRGLANDERLRDR